MPDKHLALLISCNHHRKKPRVERVGRVHREMSINHQKPSEWIHHNHHDRHHHSYFWKQSVKSSQVKQTFQIPTQTTWIVRRVLIWQRLVVVVVTAVIVIIIMCTLHVSFVLCRVPGFGCVLIFKYKYLPVHHHYCL